MFSYKTKKMALEACCYHILLNVENRSIIHWVCPILETRREFILIQPYLGGDLPLQSARIVCAVYQSCIDGKTAYRMFDDGKLHGTGECFLEQVPMIPVEIIEDE